MRNKKMLIAGLITVVMGISIVGCGNDGKSTRETESTEQVTEMEWQRRRNLRLRI